MPVLYAHSRPRRGRQLTADVLFAIWVAGSFLLAHAVYGAISHLGVLTGVVRDAAGRASDEVAVAAQRVDSLPLVGPEVAGPLGRAGRAMRELAAVAAEQISTIDALAWWTASALFVLPVALAVAMWLPWRVRFIRRATTTRDLLATGVDVDLFALRALARQPMHKLVRISADPVRAWRAGDAQVLAALAELELADLGVRAPAHRDATGPNP